MPTSPRMRSRRLGMSILCVLLCLTGLFVWTHSGGVARADSTPTDTVFYDNQSNAITVATQSQGDTISFTINNVDGGQVGQTGSASINSGQAVVSLPSLGDGYYVLNTSDGQAIPFAIVSPFSLPADSPFGIGVHYSNETVSPVNSILDLLTKAGLTGMRSDMPWQSIETSRGQFSFPSYYDSFVSTDAQHGVSPLLILDYNNPFYDNGQTVYDDSGYAAWDAYVGQVLNHYGSSIKAVEVYNEYNGFSTGPCQNNPQCYVTLLQHTYNDVKNYNANLTVIGLVLSSQDYPGFSYASDVFRDGGLAYMDAVSFHPYCEQSQVSSPPDTGCGGLGNNIAKLRGIIQQYNNGASKPIWITELGYSTIGGTSLRQQAQWTARGVATALANGVTKFYPYDLVIDGTDTSSGDDNYGITNLPDAAGQFTPRPAYVAYAVAARQLTGATASNTENAGSSDITDLVFSKNNQDLRVLWATTGSPSLTLNATGPLTVTTLFGGTSQISPSNGQVSLTLSQDPIYVSGNASVGSGTMGGGTTQFASGFESSDPALTWVNTIDTGPGQAGNISNVTGYCCNLSAPEAGVRNEIAHAGSAALLYSGRSTDARAYAYDEIYSVNIPVTSTTTLSYYVYPQDSSSPNGSGVAGNNSTCVAIDLIFSDGSNLRDSGAVDQNGHRVHPAYQCGQITTDSWNQVRANLGSLAGKTIVRIDVGFDTTNGQVGGYRGYIDDLALTNS